MKCTRKLILAGTALCLTLLLSTGSAFATSMSTVQSRMEDLKALNGLFFTTTGRTCGNNSCDVCNVVNVVASGSAFRSNSGLTKWPSSFNMSHARYNASSNTTHVVRGWSCAGFANFAGWYLFADSASSKVSYYRLIDCPYKEIYKYAKPGDLISSAGHSFVYISGNSSKIYIIDNNGITSNPHNKISVRYRSDVTRLSSMVSISRATSYDERLDFFEISRHEADNGHIYVLYGGYASWDEAKEFVSALGDGWKLATVTNEAEQSIVAGLVSKWNGYTHGGMAWLGATYGSNGWEWETEEDFAYQNWGNNTTGSSSKPHAFIVGATNTNAGYTKNMWYAGSSLHQWYMSGFVAEYNPYDADPEGMMTYTDFVTPASMQIIRQGVFRGIAASKVRLSDNVTAIEQDAFENCFNLTEVYIPAGCIDINAYAFSNCPNLEIIYGLKGSPAEEFAHVIGVRFVAVN